MGFQATWPASENEDWAFLQGLSPPQEALIVDDAQAWLCHPHHNWIYDRLSLARWQGLEAAPLGVPPASWPVVVRPIVNLYGMGQGALLAESMGDIPDEPGRFWSEYLQGEHLSIDLLVSHEGIAWAAVSRAEPGPALGTFASWHVDPQRSAEILRDDPTWPYLRRRRNAPWTALASVVCDLIRQNYRGPLNVETIGGRVIEAHLRLSPQCFSLYQPDRFFRAYDAWCRGVERVDWPRLESGWSFVSWTVSEQRSVPMEGVLDAMLPGVLSIHPMQARRSHANPPGLRRLVVVQAQDETAGRRALTLCEEAARAAPHHDP